MNSKRVQYSARMGSVSTAQWKEPWIMMPIAGTFFRPVDSSSMSSGSRMTMLSSSPWYGSSSTLQFRSWMYPIGSFFFWYIIFTVFVSFWMVTKRKKNHPNYFLLSFKERNLGPWGGILSGNSLAYWGSPVVYPGIHTHTNKNSPGG